MKIGVIAACPFLEDRGTPLRIDGFSRALTELGHEVRIITYHLGRTPSSVSYEIKRIPDLNFYQKYEAGPDPVKPIVDTFLYLRAFQEFHEWTADFVLGSHVEGGFIAALLKKTLGIPFIYDAHARFSQEMIAFNYIPDSLIAKIPFDAIEMFVLENADAVGVVSNSLKDEFQEYLGDSVPVSLLPNGVRLEEYESSMNIHDEFDIPQDRFLVVYAGNLHPYQGISYLLQTAERLPKEKFHFLIVGGPEDQHIQESKQLDIVDQVTFTGQLPINKVPPILAEADALVAPRLGTRTEGQQASKLMHYLAAGKPIVATKVPPHDMLKDRKTSILVNEESVDELAQALVELREDPNLQERLGKKAREAAEQYQWTNSANRLLDIYRNFL